MDDLFGFEQGSTIRLKLTQFDPGVNFDETGEKDFEEVDFINTIIRQLWPDIRIWLSKLVKQMEPVIRKVDLVAGLNLNMINFVGQFKFRRIDFGNIVSETFD